MVHVYKTLITEKELDYTARELPFGKDIVNKILDDLDIVINLIQAAAKVSDSTKDAEKLQQLLAEAKSEAASLRARVVGGSSTHQ
ncbi:hypothetical protein QTL95_08725 [Rhizobium sp. S152]|uniref:hypothetical protein n=1 Tax=Rhizobium sp. S152 TaxID=3055038 RepID=UPI0025A9EB6A|nr:hypothetical protein [Rhizobium sp. S152]MDM9625977.1 hypothetical protein [Rhizobium sp. S152]